MSVSSFRTDFARECLSYLKIWFGELSKVILKLPKIETANWEIYRKLPDKSHQITANGTLEPQLFSLCFTHELAHLIVLKNMVGEFLPHGAEWKQTF